MDSKNKRDSNRNIKDVKRKLVKYRNKGKRKYIKKEVI